MYDPTSEPRRSSLRWGLVAGALLLVIVTPFVAFEPEVNALSERLLAPGVGRRWIAAAVILLYAADVLLPVPSSVVGTASGALLGLATGALVSWIGLTAGSLLAYGLGRWGGRPALSRWVGPEELSRAERLAEARGALAIVVTRPVPVLAEASTLLAGALRAPLPAFLVAAGLSNAGVAVAYAAVGATASSYSSFLLAFLGAIALPAAFAGVVGAARRR